MNVCLVCFCFWQINTVSNTLSGYFFSIQNIYWLKQKPLDDNNFLFILSFGKFNMHNRICFYCSEDINFIVSCIVSQALQDCLIKKMTSKNYCHVFKSDCLLYGDIRFEIKIALSQRYRHLHNHPYSCDNRSLTAIVTWLFSIERERTKNIMRT
jgi:hypothetical protein